MLRWSFPRGCNGAALKLLLSLLPIVIQRLPTYYPTTEQADDFFIRLICSIAHRVFCAQTSSLQTSSAGFLFYVFPFYYFLFLFSFSNLPSRFMEVLCLSFSFHVPY